MWHPVAEFNPSLTVLFVADLERVKFIALLPIGIVNNRNASKF